MRQFVVEDVDLLHWKLDELAEYEPPGVRVLSIHFTIDALRRHVDNQLARPFPPPEKRVKFISHRGRVCPMLADLPEGSEYDCVIVLSERP